MSAQAPGAVLLVRPRYFVPNPQTAADNVFQVAGPAPGSSAAALSCAAYDEVTRVAETLQAQGIRVHLFDDEDPARPDSVFPNNWLSTHAGGRIAVHPMYAPNRRTERRWDIIETLKAGYRVQDVIDSSGLELDGVFLEGTGAMVLDHASRVAYVARSRRADPVALERFCTAFGYEPMVFDATDPAGVPVYHTNVMMCVGTDFALVGLDLIASQQRRVEVAERLGQYGRAVIDLTYEQVCDFAGNAIELRTPTGRVLAMSRRGLASLRPEQREAIEASCRILPLDVPTIELAGGSVRCMVVGVHLDPRPAGTPVQAAAPSGHAQLTWLRSGEAEGDLRPTGRP
ncbi:MAG: arginine deiminase-related protein [Intrasporangium sp.]|uniref:citrulline utilization hydrolase CtlX n=1 Tax=Intrasporangium sp. TaxID=1925024 RepID=UPI0026496EEE|nr:arginine deiminase-related protein [Intrasporangium sp.]MDN5794350.1 arginine deiminase-related protein [Intrasporangium sp.]